MRSAARGKRHGKHSPCFLIITIGISQPFRLLKKPDFYTNANRYRMSYLQILERTYNNMLLKCACVSVRVHAYVFPCASVCVYVNVCPWLSALSVRVRVCACVRLFVWVRVFVFVHAYVDVHRLSVANARSACYCTFEVGCACQLLISNHRFFYVVCVPQIKQNHLNSLHLPYLRNKKLNNLEFYQLNIEPFKLFMTSWKR